MQVGAEGEFFCFVLQTEHKLSYNTVEGQRFVLQNNTRIRFKRRPVMNTRILLFSLGVAACIVFFSAKAATARGPGSGIGIRPGFVSVQLGPGYGRLPGYYSGFPSYYHRSPIIIVAPPRPLPPHVYYGPHYGPPARRPYIGFRRW